MPRVKIREAVLSDAQALSSLGANTFAGSFQQLYSAENLNRFLAEFHSEAFYTDVLQDPEKCIYVAQQGSNLVGYCLIKPNSLPCTPPRLKALELSRLYLYENQRGKGVGAQLMKDVIDYADRKNTHDIVLSVYSENYGAHKFYARYGFEKIGDYEFIVGDHRDAEWIMLRST